MHSSLMYIHSAVRYIILLLLILSILKAFSGWFGRKPFTGNDRKLGLFTLIAAHIQLILGLILYFMSDVVKTGMSDMGAAMKDKLLRFWTVEHMVMMLLAIVLITLGYSLSKRAKDDSGRFKRIAIFFMLALIVIFLAIPWPFSSDEIARPWF